MANNWIWTQVIQTMASVIDNGGATNIRILQVFEHMHLHVYTLFPYLCTRTVPNKQNWAAVEPNGFTMIVLPCNLQISRIHGFSQRSGGMTSCSGEAWRISSLMTWSEWAVNPWICSRQWYVKKLPDEQESIGILTNQDLQLIIFHGESILIVELMRNHRQTAGSFWKCQPFATYCHTVDGWIPPVDASIVLRSRQDPNWSTSKSLRRSHLTAIV